MAVKPDAILINFTPADGNYPYGSGKDETAPAALDGSEYKKVRADDVFGMQQALLVQAGIVPSGTADTAVASQYLQSLLHLTLQGSTFVDSGAADVYVLTSPIANHQPAAYKDGQKYVFKVNATNTGGPATVNVSGLGAKSLKIPGTIDPIAGDLEVGRYVTIIYNLGLDRFDLAPLDLLMKATTGRRGASELADDVETQAGTDPARVVTPAGLESKTATDTRKGIAETATKTEQEGAADLTRIVTPGRQQYHPSAAKAWIVFDGTGVINILASHNVASIVDNGVGLTTINFTVPFSSVNFNWQGSCIDDASTGIGAFVTRRLGDVKTVSSIQIRTISILAAGGAVVFDSEEVCLSFFGDQ